MLINYFLITAAGFAISIPLIYLLEKVSLKSRILTAHSGMPLVGGVGITLSFIFACVFWSFLNSGMPQIVKGIILSSSVMLIFGVLDDWQEFSVTTKFLVQLVATSLLVISGIKTQIVYAGAAVNIIITFIWVLGITNAINHLDVIDGLAAGVTAIVSLAFFLVSFLNGNMHTGAISLSLAAASLGFLRYNFPPARLYMGNSGSHFLGFVLAAVALSISYAPSGREIALFTPLLILGLPILDTAFLIVIRIMKKNQPFKKSNDHLALRFLFIGYSKKKALLSMLGLCLFFCLCGIFLNWTPNLWGIGILLLAAAVSLIITKRLAEVVVND